MISLKERVHQDREFTRFEQAKTGLFFSYHLTGIIHRYLRKSTLYMNGFCNSEQFDSAILTSLSSQ